MKINKSTLSLSHTHTQSCMHTSCRISVFQTSGNRSHRGEWPGGIVLPLIVTVRVLRIAPEFSCGRRSITDSSRPAYHHRFCVIFPRFRPDSRIPPFQFGFMHCDESKSCKIAEMCFCVLFLRVVCASWLFSLCSLPSVFSVFKWDNARLPSAKFTRTYLRSASCCVLCRRHV